MAFQATCNYEYYGCYFYLLCKPPRNVIYCVHNDTFQKLGPHIYFVHDIAGTATLSNQVSSIVLNIVFNSIHCYVHIKHALDN